MLLADDNDKQKVQFYTTFLFKEIKVEIKADNFADEKPFIFKDYFFFEFCMASNNAAEESKILERLALNEHDETPWPEVRRMLRQRIAQAIEMLDDKPVITTTDKKQESEDKEEEEGEDKTPAVATSKEDDDDNRLKDMRDLEERINYCLHTFDEAPFTIQRIAELVAWPERHYRSVVKFLRAIERVVYVTSTVEEFPLATAKPEIPAVMEEPATATTTTTVSTISAAAQQPSSLAVAAVESGGGNGGGPPLDASDTGILHLTPSSSPAEDQDSIMARIGGGGDPGTEPTKLIPVCIDDPATTAVGGEKVTVQPMDQDDDDEEEEK